MPITQKFFAGSYYYVAHVWYDGMLFLSPDALHRISALNGVALIFAYFTMALTIFDSFSVWVLVAIFVLLEFGFWFFYRRQDQYAEIVSANLDEQVEAIRLAVWLHAGVFISFLITVAYNLWEMEHRILNEKSLVPAIMFPLLVLSLVGMVLLISRLIRVLRERQGKPSRSPRVSGERMVYWIFVPALAGGIIIASFVGGFVFAAILIAIAAYRFVANCERNLLELID